MFSQFNILWPIRWLRKWQQLGLVVLAIMTILFMLSSSFEPWYKLPTISTPLTYPIHLSQQLWFNSIKTVTSWWHHYVYLRHTAEQNHQLRQEIKQLHRQLLEQHSYSEQLSVLKELLEFKQNSPHPLIAATVINTGGSHFQELIKIDKGSTAKIQVGMPALSPSGVVGWVMRVHSHHSLIQPLSSIRSSIDILVQRTRLRGILKGSGHDTLLWEPKLSADIMIGDVVISSGLVGYLPKGYRVARVAAITYDLNMAAKVVELHPSQNPTHLEHLFIMNTHDPILSTLSSTPSHHHQNLP